MTDTTLVRDLRDWANVTTGYPSLDVLLNDAADRIEALSGESAPSSVTSPCQRCGGRGQVVSNESVGILAGVDTTCFYCHGSGVTPTEKAGER